MCTDRHAGLHNSAFEISAHFSVEMKHKSQAPTCFHNQTLMHQEGCMEEAGIGLHITCIMLHRVAFGIWPSSANHIKIKAIDAM